MSLHLVIHSRWSH